ncbi:Fis family transcriptional regulator [Thalassotalea maritima]|uniref:Fis family transcriptional regulator n=1 Tax=Thalassotalea maritima TaxID=3242416 RepID=UPI003528DBA3
MRKSDKKIDNQLRQVLTDVCEMSLKDIHGFQWLTHTVNFSNFPSSLRIVCVFDTNENRQRYLSSEHKQRLQSRIKGEFDALGIALKHIAKHIVYDSEENCAEQHNGNWAKRLA